MNRQHELQQKLADTHAKNLFHSCLSVEYDGDDLWKNSVKRINCTDQERDDFIEYLTLLGMIVRHPKHADWVRVNAIAPQPPEVAEPADKSKVEFDGKRLRRLVNTLDLSSAVPESDEELLLCIGTVLGTACRKIAELKGEKEGYYEEQPDGSVLPVDPADIGNEALQQAAKAKPVEYQTRMRPELFHYNTGWSDWEKCSEEDYNEKEKLLPYGGWQYEVRKLYASPQPSNAEFDSTQHTRMIAIRNAFYSWYEKKYKIPFNSGRDNELAISHAWFAAIDYALESGKTAVDPHDMCAFERVVSAMYEVQPAGGALADIGSANTATADHVSHSAEMVLSNDEKIRCNALEEAAKLAIQWGNARLDDHGGNALRNCAQAIRALQCAKPAAELEFPGVDIDVAHRSINDAEIAAQPAESVIKQSLTTDAEGWIEWTGGACPVADDILVLYDHPQEALRDAARYRWLRHGDNDEAVLRELNGDLSHYLPRNEKLDEAIDSAIAAEKAGKV